jgi:hypothetical protein
MQGGGCVKSYHDVYAVESEGIATKHAKRWRFLYGIGYMPLLIAAIPMAESWDLVRLLVEHHAWQMFSYEILGIVTLAAVVIYLWTSARAGSSKSLQKNGRWIVVVRILPVLIIYAIQTHLALALASSGGCLF